MSVHMIASLPQVPEWMSAASLDKFIPFIVEIMMTVTAGLYDLFVPLMSVLIWTLVGFKMGLFVVKNFMPPAWTDFFGIKGGGEYYDAKKAKEQTWNLPTTYVKMIMRAAIATTILLAARPAFLTEVIVNPFLKVGSIYTEFILNDASGQMDELPMGAECKPGTARGFFGDEACQQIANPIAGIVYKNNQVITFGLDMMGVPSFITNSNTVPIQFDVGQLLFNFIVGAILVITFFLAGLYIASIMLQGLLNFCFAIMLFPFKVFGWVMNDSTWANVWPALKGITDSLRNLVVAMIIGGIMTVINLFLIVALFGESGIEANLDSWSAKFTAMLAAVLSLLVMTKLMNVAKEKLAKYGAPDDAFYKSLVGNTQGLGKAAVKIGKNIKTLATTKKTGGTP